MVNANPYSRPEFIWRFYSCQKHYYHCVIAATESEARSLLPDAPCIFSARFSIQARNNLTYWSLPARSAFYAMEAI
ncbi:host cell division inhibitor Icd-like protein [Salmonella enterica subsp. enterica]|nr:host cell division inhibitor Icd-like protein [Salmonella enterica subsp. enterica]